MNPSARLPRARDAGGRRLLAAGVGLLAVGLFVFGLSRWLGGEVMPPVPAGTAIALTVAVGGATLTELGRRRHNRGLLLAGLALLAVLLLTVLLLSQTLSAAGPPEPADPSVSDLVALAGAISGVIAATAGLITAIAGLITARAGARRRLSKGEQDG